MSLTLTRRHNVNRFGYLIPTKYGNVPMVGAVATYRPGEGRFGGAVAVEEATENAFFTLGGGYVSWLRDLAVGQSTDRSVGGGTVRFTRLGEHRFRAEVIADLSGAALINLASSSWTWPANQPHTISAYVLDYYEAPGTTHAWGLGRSSWGGAHLHGRDGLGRKTYTYQDADDRTASMAIRATSTDAVIKAGTRIEWEFAQVELNKPFATSFVAGTRAEGRLVYPTSVFNPAQGTVSMWVRKHQLIDYNARVFWSATGSYRFGIHDSPSGGLTWAYVTASGQTGGGFLTPGTWHHLVMTWHRDEGWMRGYLDGEPVASRTFDPGTDPGFVYSNTWGLGATVSGSQAFNGLFDELLILPYAASEEEIRAWYEADGPIPPHPDASLQWDWQAVRPATMVAL